MRFLLIYFSGTGNTRLIADSLAGVLESSGHEVVSETLEEVLDRGRIGVDAEALFLGFPVYKLTFPDSFQRLFPLLTAWRGGRSRRGKFPLVLFSSYCRFNGSSLAALSRRLRPLGFSLCAAASFKSPSNGIASLKDFKSPASREVMYFENRIAMKIADFAGKAELGIKRCRKNGFRLFLPDLPFYDQRVALVDAVEKARYPFLSIDRERCSRCGLCARLCPEGNLVEEASGIRILDPEGCLHCLRCLHRCPRQAVSFGPLVVGPERYSPKRAARLFEEAEGRAAEAPCEGNPRIWRRWALGNLRYWWNKRKERRFLRRSL